VLGSPKSEAGVRTVPLAPELVRMLQAHLAAQREHVLRRGAAYDRDLDLVFAGQDGEIIDPNTLRHSDWAKLCRAAKLKVQIYDLRHSAATELLPAGVNPKLASEMLGHADTELLLNVYGHARRTRRRGPTLPCGSPWPSTRSGRGWRTGSSFPLNQPLNSHQRRSPIA
jgi:integrase